MPKLHSQDFLERDQFQSLGVIAAEWSLLEAYLSVAIWRLLDTDRGLGLTVTADLNALAKINLFHAVCVERFEHTNSLAMSEATELHKRLGALNTKRNNFVHNIWVTGHEPNTLKAQKYSVRGGRLKVTPLKAQATEMMETAIEIGVLVDDIDDFRERWTGALPEK